MKRLVLLLLSCSLGSVAISQRTMTEGTIMYDLAASGASAGAANVFDGASFTVYMKGSQVLQELKTNSLSQTTLYDNKSDSAIILKQAGEQKFIIHLNSANWRSYNRRYEDIHYTLTEETKNVAGFPCKKATAKLADGTEIAVFYATTLSPLVKNYDYQFRNLPGLALEYEVQTGGTKVTYTANRVMFNPVPAFKFDIPKTGYRILDYKSS